MAGLASVGILIPTYKGRELLPRILPNLRSANPHLPILVIDSSSNDGTAEFAKTMGAEVEIIPQAAFNHGLTREYGRKKLGTDVVVMMTQDAIPESDDLIRRLTAPILAGQAAVSYARQLPHRGAKFFESFPREYNYPDSSYSRGITDVKTFGSKTYFCSDSCAAWSNSALDEVGGFEAVLLGEDAVAVARLLAKGHKISYVADAVVRHSHDYSLLQELRRHFDAGFERNRFRDLLFGESGDERHGRTYAVKMFSRLAQEQPSLLFKAVLHIGAKFVGYFLGKNSRLIPPNWWHKLSSQPYYWSSKFRQNLR